MEAQAVVDRSNRTISGLPAGMTGSWQMRDGPGLGFITYLTVKSGAGLAVFRSQWHPCWAAWQSMVIATLRTAKLYIVSPLGNHIIKRSTYGWSVNSSRNSRREKVVVFVNFEVMINKCSSLYWRV